MTSTRLLEVSPRLNGLMKIFVKILDDNRTLKMDVEASDTIASIKTKIHRDTRIPLDHQRLIRKNTELEDSSQLSEYNINHYALLKLALKRPSEKSTTMCCEVCHVGFFPDEEDCRVYLCRTCAANIAIAGEFCTINGYPQKKKQRTK